MSVQEKDNHIKYLRVAPKYAGESEWQVTYLILLEHNSNFLLKICSFQFSNSEDWPSQLVYQVPMFHTFERSVSYQVTGIRMQCERSDDLGDMSYEILVKRNRKHIPCEE
jgi:hypothetical protein